MPKNLMILKRYNIWRECTASCKLEFFDEELQTSWFIWWMYAWKCKVYALVSLDLLYLSTKLNNS